MVHLLAFRHPQIFLRSTTQPVVGRWRNNGLGGGKVRSGGANMGRKNTISIRDWRIVDTSPSFVQRGFS